MDIDLSRLLTYLQGLARPYPARDWFLVSVVAGTVGVAGVALAAYLFVAVQTGSIVSGATEVPRAPIPVSREAIQNVLTIYQTRASNYASKTFAPVTLNDPRPRR